MPRPPTSTVVRFDVGIPTSSSDSETPTSSSSHIQKRRDDDNDDDEPSTSSGFKCESSTSQNSKPCHRRSSKTPTTKMSPTSCSLFLLVYSIFLLPSNAIGYSIIQSFEDHDYSHFDPANLLQESDSDIALWVKKRASGAYKGTDENLELSVLLSKLDDNKHMCGDVVEAEKLLHTAVSKRHPRLIQLAQFFANHSRDFTPDLLESSSFDRKPPIDNLYVNDKDKPQFFILQLNCSNNTKRWLPRLVFSSPEANGRKGFLTLRLDPFEFDLCSSVNCSTKCSWTVHNGLKVLAKACCSEDTDKTLCRTDAERGRNMLLLFNAICAVICLVLIPVVYLNRRRQHEARGWALMEMFLIGASILYSILLLNWLTPPEAGCCIAVWLRQIGFSIFYGSIVLKIYRNLQEYRVRKAQHVSVREQDMMKYLAAMLALTITGLMAWTVGSWGDTALWLTAWPQCHMQGWHVIWHGYELLFLIYGMRLCYKARNSDWLERWQFTVAVCLEAIITLMANLIRYSIRNSGHSDTLFTVAFVQIQLTVSVNMVIIIAPKFYLSSGESNRRSMTIGGHSGRAHPSLAKLRDNILNGTIDFAEVPIVDMNPEDIRAELKRVYTQLRMYKLKNLYQDNPHISKKRGGKKWSDKTASKAEKRRISIPGCSPQATKSRIEEDEKSDLTVESSPHNIYLSNYKLQLEPNHSVRV